MSQQTAKKTGSKSSAEKAVNTRPGTQPMSATQPTRGAFGKEPPDQVAGENSPMQKQEPALKQAADQIGAGSGEANACL